MQTVYIGIACMPLLFALIYIIYFAVQYYCRRRREKPSASIDKRRRQRVSEFEEVTKRKRVMRFVWASVASTAVAFLL